MPPALRAYWNKKKGKTGKTTRARKSAPRSAPRRKKARRAPMLAKPAKPRRRRGGGRGSNWLLPALIGAGAILALGGAAPARPNL